MKNKLRGLIMNKIKIKVFVFFLVLTSIMIVGCSISNDVPDLEKIKIEVVNESVHPGVITYTLRLKNESDAVIVQNNVYASFPITNIEKNHRRMSEWKVEAGGNELNIKPGQEVILHVVMPTEYFMDNELIYIGMLDIEIKGYLDSLEEKNSFAMAGDIGFFDSNFKSEILKQE